MSFLKMMQNLSIIFCITSNWGKLVFCFWSESFKIRIANLKHKMNYMYYFLCKKSFLVVAFYTFGVHKEIFLFLSPWHVLRILFLFSLPPPAQLWPKISVIQFIKKLWPYFLKQTPNKMKTSFNQIFNYCFHFHWRF